MCVCGGGGGGRWFNFESIELPQLLILIENHQEKVEVKAVIV